MESKKLKLADEKEDRISDLPDCLIHHILSFLPSTQQAVRTGILSKRWQNQWTRVPVLIFHRDGMSEKSYFNFINKTLILHDCSKINKFHLYLNRRKLTRDPEIDLKIQFATNKNVEDLDLELCQPGLYLLPQFLFNNASLVRLKITCGKLAPIGKINWGSLTELILRNCIFMTNQRIEHILSSCPLLESLGFDDVYSWSKNTVIASKSLKRLVLSYFTSSYLKISCPNIKELSLRSIFIDDPKLFLQLIESVLSESSLLESMSIQSICSVTFDKLVVASTSLKRLVLSYFTSSYLKISCPNIKELSLRSIFIDDPKLFLQLIESVLSESSLLESMSIQSIRSVTFDKLVVASTSLKRLVVRDISMSSIDVEISCPNLEILNLADSLNVNTAKLLNLPSSLCASIDFYQSDELQTRKKLIEDILQQLQHIRELKIGSWFLKVLSTIKVRGGFSGPLNIKCLTLNSPYTKSHHSGIARLLSISPQIDKLIINIPSFINRKVKHMRGNNYWNANATVFNCMVSHLKTLKIVVYGFKEGDARREHMLNLVQFLLINARVLEKMVVIVEDDGTRLPSEVSQKLLGLSSCSQDAIVEVLYPKEIKD